MLLGVILYMALMLVIGYWSRSKIKSPEDFLVAGRHLPYPLATATLFATWFGAGSCMGASGTVYEQGILGVISDPIAAGLSLIIAGLFYVRLLRRLKLLTVVDIFGKYYGKNCEFFAAFLMVPVYISWLGSQIVALGFLLNFLTGIDASHGMILSTFFVLFYTYIGGMWAITLVDILHVTVLISGLLIMFVVILNHVGGVGPLLAQTPSDFVRFFPSNAGFHDWLGYAGQWGLMGLGCVVGQDLVQKSLSSKNEKVAQQSAISAGLIYWCTGTMIILISLSGRLILPGLEDPETLLPNMGMKFLPLVALVLFIGALVSAIMSSAAASLLAATSLATHNLIFKIFPLNEKTVLRGTRIATIIVTVLALALALYIKQIYALMVNSWVFLFVGILVPVTAALYWKKANAPAAWTSMIAGSLAWAIYVLTKTGNLSDVSDEIFYQAAMVGGLVSFGGYLLATFLRYSKIIPVKTACEYPPEN
ncbi:MAG: sodium:solute symporter family protein [Candidatus Omnitrophica bacterium]|nr:sodium:solute symporter family protein [Candidatus Omnitrophota bacterium]